MMKRGGHTKEKIARVEEALGDGDLDDEDVVLLNELLPPEPKEDWERILLFMEVPALRGPARAALLCKTRS